jgi:hypothetical protein
MAPTKVDWLHKLSGTVVCIASGPSLTAEDCERVRGLPSIVTNTTFRLCPWATVLIAHDKKWWEMYGKEVRETFPGHKVTVHPGGRHHGAQVLALLKFRTFRNSGAAAISLAALAGAKRVIMIGYDCQHTNGQTHWHGNHPAGLGNAGSVPKWPEYFRQVALYARRQGCEVINATRQTALTCFPRATLEECLPAEERVAA